VCPFEPNHCGSPAADLLVVGAGAAGLATAIFAARAAPALTVLCVDGARRPGAKILVSGGTRCNVTNREVDERDFRGGSSRLVGRVLRAFPAPRAAAFFAELGVPLHEEEHGKLFPDTNRARTVLDALLNEAARCRIEIRPSSRVRDLTPSDDGFLVSTGESVWRARSVVLATGGRSLPKTGSDGFGYELAGRLGHGYVETTPALAPLVLDGDVHRDLAGVSHAVALTCEAGNRRVRVEGSLLWTHFGISGPAALDASRHWHRGRLEGCPGRVWIDVCPQHSIGSLDAWLLAQRDSRPRALVVTVLAGLLPAAVAVAWCRACGLPDDLTMSHLTREQRRAVVQVLHERELLVRDSRGYNYAEVTAGGIPLDEVDVATMESRVCPGLYLVGEILDADGRLGGFNFQWAWSSAWVAGQAIGRRSAAE
jgi:hypothetical protein